MFQPFSEKTYQFMKWTAAIAIPATAALAGTIGLAAGWAHVGTAVTIISAFGTFTGALVGVSSATYAAINKETGGDG